MIQMNNSPSLNSKLTEMFTNPDIIKLGISFSGDIRNVKQSYKEMTSFDFDLNNYIDLLDYYKEMYNELPGGLAGLCERVLGIHLCKGEQMSNWEKRPLKFSQMHYAALDSYVLIDIYKELKDIRLRNGHVGVILKAGKACENCNSRIHEKPNCHRGPKCCICQQFGHIPEKCPN